MRNTNLEDRLRADAPAWRNALASGARPTAHREQPGPRRLLARAAGVLAAAALLAAAGLLWLQLPAERPPAEPPAPPRPARATPLVEPELLAQWAPALPVAAPPMQLTDAEALVTEPLRLEADRIQNDVASAVWFVVDLVPGA